MKAERYFNGKRRALDSSTTVNDLIHAFTCDYFEPQRIAECKRLRKELNKLYRGDFEKSKAHFHRLLNEAEHNFYSI